MTLVSVKNSNGLQSIIVHTGEGWNKGDWSFCMNGWQSTGVNITVEMFDMMQKLVHDPDVVEFYEKMRDAN